MVTLAAIASGSGVDDPDLAVVFERLNTLAQPLAEPKKPLQIIAPAVWRMHRRARLLETALDGKKLAPDRLAQMVARSFSKIADFHVIITGIVPPSNPVERDQYEREVEFGRKMVEIAYRLLKEVGGKPTAKWAAVEISKERCDEYASQVAELRKKHPLPAFAEEEQIRRRSEGCSWVGWLILFWFIAAHIGFLGAIIEAIANLFKTGNN